MGSRNRKNLERAVGGLIAIVVIVIVLVLLSRVRDTRRARAERAKQEEKERRAKEEREREQLYARRILNAHRRKRDRTFLRDEKKRQSRFYFVKAAFIQSTKLAVLPSFQKLRDMPDSPLTTFTITRREAYRGHFAWLRWL